MRRRLHTLLLILVTLSVAIAPLRGAWALPDDTGTVKTESHCAGMQQMDHDANHGGKTDKCKSSCNGSCCDNSCSVCLHATAAIPVNLVLLRDAPDHEHDIPAMDTFPERHLKPPLRPPLAIHS